MHQLPEGLGGGGGGSCVSNGGGGEGVLGSNNAARLRRWRLRWLLLGIGWGLILLGNILCRQFFNKFNCALLVHCVS
jgi:hypothetical protein